MSTFRFRSLIAVVLAALLPLVTLGQTAPAKTEFKAGDKVIVTLLGEQEAEVVGVAANGWIKVKIRSGGGFAERNVPPQRVRLAEQKAPATGTADQPAPGDTPATPATPANKPGEDGKRQPQRGDIVTLKDGTKGYFIEFDGRGYVHLTVERGARRIPFPHFAKVEQIVSIEPAPKKVDPRREKRIWTDSTGKFKTEASYVRVHDGKVELKKADGSIAKVPLNQLSAADLKIAQALAAEEQLSRQMEDVFGGGVPKELGGLAEAFGGVQKTDAPGITTVEPNWSQCRQLSLEDQTPSGGFTPDPAPALAAALTERPIAIPPLRAGKELIAEEPVHLQFAAGKAQALVTFQVHDRSGEQKRLVRCDLVSGKMLESLALPEDTVPLDTDAEGRVLVGHTPFTAVGLGRVDCFGIESGQTKLIASWRPYPSAQPRGAFGVGNEYDQVIHAAVIDKDHILTVDPAHRLTVWKAAEAKALYTVAMDFGELPAVSGGGKYLAVTAPHRTVYVLEALTGKPVMKFTWTQPFGPFLSFHPDGRRLAGAYQASFQVWDLTTGKRLHDIGLFLTTNNHNHGNDITWPAEGFLLHGLNLVDLKRGLLLWHYRKDATTPARGSFGGRYWNLERVEQGHIIASTPVPHAEALRVADGLDAENVLALKPGMEIAISVRMGVPDQQAVYDSLAKRLTDNGMKVVANANLVLYAATGAGRTEEVEYRSRDEPFKPGKKVPVARLSSTLWITENGKPIWVSSQYVGAPGMVQLGPNDDLRTVVEKQMRPDTDLFLTSPLPKQVVRPGNDTSEAYGNSRIIDLTSK